MDKWSVVSLLCSLGVASLAHAHAHVSSGSSAVSTRPRVAQGAYRPRGKALRLGGLSACSAPQLVREDQGIGAFQDVPAAGGTFVMLVWSGAQCGRSVSENSDFIVDVKGSGSEKVTYTVQPNTGAARTAYIAASSGSETSTFAIRQAAGAGGTSQPQTPPATTPVSSALSNDPSLLGTQRTCGAVAVTVVKSGAVLKPEAWVLSPSRQYKLIFQTDGNLVLYKANGDFLWNTGKLVPGGVVKMQSDGNFVAYDTSSKAQWASNTSKKEGSFLAVQDDGKLIVYSPESCNTVVHWSAR